ncbi:hypothetical protein JGC56_13690 [Salmonella enterica subsp. enterica serovar Saintpaul]|nr:hypothetical protein [Salmonella enterica subsp. enterica serovar Saintpaul]
MPIVISKTSAHNVSNITQPSHQNTKSQSHFSTLIKSVKNGTLHVKGHNHKTHAVVQKDMQKNNLSLVKNESKSECRKQIDDLMSMQRYVNEQNTRLAAELDKMDARNGSYIDKKAITVELAKRLNESVNNNDFNNYGPLYKMVMTEESQIITSSLTPKELAISSNQTFSHNEKLVLQKKAAETKLAVADFCLRILRLNEQAEWTPPRGSMLNAQSAVNADDLLSAGMQNALSKPYFDSKRGIDSASGLYHERQIYKSGSCAMHANNHYLAAWCAREERPFLALTPRRLELLLSAIQNRQNTEVKELETMYAQQNEEFSADAKTVVQSKLKRNEKFILDDEKKNTLVEYGKYYDIAEIKDTVLTGNVWGDKIAELINQSYGLPVQVDFIHNDALSWYYQPDAIHQLEGKQDSLICVFVLSNKTSSHAVCFNKKEGVWYLQDSNLPSPIICSPSDLINHFCGMDNYDSVLRNIEGIGEYRSWYKVDSNCAVDFTHFEPH